MSEDQYQTLLRIEELLQKILGCMQREVVVAETNTDPEFAYFNSKSESRG